MSEDLSQYSNVVWSEARQAYGVLIHFDPEILAGLRKRGLIARVNLVPVSDELSMEFTLDMEDWFQVDQ